MKHLLVVLTILILYSCSLDNQSGKKKELVKDTIQNPNLLLGEWSVYEHIGGGVDAKCNVCPKVSFNEDQTATVIFPSGEKGNLKWTTSGNRLILTIIDSKNVTELFHDSQYEMTFTQEKDCLKLEMKQTTKNYSEMLRR